MFPSLLLAVLKVISLNIYNIYPLFTLLNTQTNPMSSKHNFYFPKNSQKYYQIIKLSLFRLCIQGSEDTPCSTTDLTPAELAHMLYVNFDREQRQLNNEVELNGNNGNTSSWLNMLLCVFRVHLITLLHSLLYVAVKNK